MGEKVQELTKANGRGVKDESVDARRKENRMTPLRIASLLLVIGGASAPRVEPRAVSDGWRIHAASQACVRFSHDDPDPPGQQDCRISAP